MDPTSRALKEPIMALTPIHLKEELEALDMSAAELARKLENKLKRQGRGSGFYRLIGLTPPSGS